MSSIYLTFFDERKAARMVMRTAGGGKTLRRLRLQAVKQLHKLIVGLCPDDWLTVNHEGRGALHANLLGGSGFLLHDAGVFAGIQALIESGRIQAHLLGKAFQVVLVECPLVLTGLTLEQQVVVLPKLTLVGGTLTGFRCPL
jgi:hypothetical protein